MEWFLIEKIGMGRHNGNIKKINIKKSFKTLKNIKTTLWDPPCPSGYAWLKKLEVAGSH